jgi:hypothetical protein
MKPKDKTFEYFIDKETIPTDIKFNIITFCTKETEGYAIALHKSMTLLSSRKIQLNFMCTYSTNCKYKLSMFYTIPISNNEGGDNHGKTINESIHCVFSKISNQYNIFCDTDIIILIKNWDIIIYQELQKYNIFSIEYPKASRRYQYLPTTRFFASNSDTLMGIDFSNGHTTINVDNNELSKMYNKPINSEVNQDAGYMIPEYIYNNKLMHLTLPCISMKNKNYILPVNMNTQRRYMNNQWNMCHWNYNGYPFLTHCQAGRRSNILKRFQGEWYKAAQLFVKNKYKVNI